MTDTKSSTEVWITGIGLATSLGEGLDAHWDALGQRQVGAAGVDVVIHSLRRAHRGRQAAADPLLPEIGAEHVTRDFDREDSAVVASEFSATSLTSGGDGAEHA